MCASSCHDSYYYNIIIIVNITFRSRSCDKYIESRIPRTQTVRAGKADYISVGNARHKPA